MDKFELSKKILEEPTIDKIPYIQNICKGKSVLDLGCIRHNSEFAINDPNWLHKKIRDVSEKVVGVDYVEAEVKKLNSLGYNIVYGDVTKPINISEKFDVILAGDIIEHLSNFEGFFNNCTNLLKDDGVLIITTGNPFFSGTFHYIALKKMFFVNQEHTCWIDPQTLLQLSERFNYQIKNIHFFNQSWALKNFISESKNNQFDMFAGAWVDMSFEARLKRKIFGIIFEIFYFPYRMLFGNNSKLVKHSDYLVVLKKSK